MSPFAVFAVFAVSCGVRQPVRAGGIGDWWLGCAVPCSYNLPQKIDPRGVQPALGNTANTANTANFVEMRP